MTPIRHLSIVDGGFLHLETAEMPMHVGSLALFDPPEGAAAGSWIDGVRAHIAGRLHLADVFTRKLAPLPLDLANPVWVDDDDVDLEYHIRHASLPAPGTMAQLQALAARLHAAPLDRSRPLWEFHLIDGLADGRLALYSKVHHAAVDGAAALALADSIFDPTPQPREVKRPRRRRKAAVQPGISDLLGASLSNQWLQLRRFVKALPPLAAAALDTARTAAVSRLRQPGDHDEQASRLKLAPATPFNVPISGQRIFAGFVLPLQPLKLIGKAHQASINDMVMWLCSTALRDYLLGRRELPEQTLVASVPFSLRAAGDASNNNQVSMTLIDLATQIEDPLQRLGAITTASRTMKAGIGTFGRLLPQDFPSLGAPWLLGAVASLIGRTELATRLRPTNVVISNLPGPQAPLYLAGARMSSMFPMSIVVHGIALNITVQSYLGQLCFGLTACRHAVPDLPSLAAHLQRAMELAVSLPAPGAAASSPRSARRSGRDTTRKRAAPASAPAAKPAAAAKGGAGTTRPRRSSADGTA